MDLPKDLLQTDPDLALVVAELTTLDQDGSIFAGIIRETIDQLLDGRRTGRWDYSQLYKTEKTHLGTLIEINLQKYFGFDDGDATDYRISGIEVDCKFSQRIGGWEMGPEMIGHYCLVIWASDKDSSWRAGLVKADREFLRDVTNRDAKRRLTEQGVTRIHWLWPDNQQLSPNQLLHLPEDSRSRIMQATSTPGRKTSVPARVNQLFREIQGQIVRRATLETVAYGAEDPMKRARGNGGARDMLRPEGIVVLGHQDNDPKVALALDLPVPQKGELIAVRLAPVSRPTNLRPAAEIDGRFYAVALPEEKVTEAPLVPRSSP